MFLATNGCQSLFFYPSNKQYLDPASVKLGYEDVFFKNRDGTKLHAWFLPAVGEAKGSILFTHGNAENISSHVASVHWLPAEGWNVFLFDYQGYGKSEGSPTFKNCIADAEDAFRWLQVRDKRPLVLFGQSLGAAVIVNVASRPEFRSSIRTTIIDSGFSSFPRIFRDKLNEFWITWPLQYPLSWFITSAYDPLPRIPSLAGMPLLFVHGQRDGIVPPYHTDLMFAAAGEPKQIWRPEEAGHIQSLQIKEYRMRLLEYLDGILKE